MQRLLTLAATYRAPLNIHMDADPASVAELERLHAMDRKGSVIWAHCGRWAAASLVGRLMAQHPNLLCELSWRDDRQVGRFAHPNVPITEFRRRLRGDWKALLEKHSERFLLGTDSEDLGGYQEIVDFFRAVLAQLTPSVARRIAYENVQGLFRLAPQ